MRTAKDKRIVDVKLTDIAKYERAAKEKVYKVGTVLVQVSATRGQTLILEKDSKVESYYVAIEPTIQFFPFYLYIITKMAIPEFLKKYQTGLNIQTGAFNFMKLRMHTSLETQAEIVEGIMKRERFMTLTEKAIESMENVKKNMLENMFV